MAEEGSWPAIRAQGLLSTTALLDLYEVTGEKRRALEKTRRPRSVAISRDGLPNAVIRDQKPMTDAGLEKCLTDGVTPEEWYAILNKRTFFWLSQERLRGLLKARAYRDQTQTVLTLDTHSLLMAHRDCIVLSPINSGATLYKPPSRGLNTFRPIADYPFDDLKKNAGMLRKPWSNCLSWAEFQISRNTLLQLTA
jgi:hypothetical protein